MLDVWKDFSYHHLNQTEKAAAFSRQCTLHICHTTNKNQIATNTHQASNEQQPSTRKLQTTNKLNQRTTNTTHQRTTSNTHQPSSNNQQQATNKQHATRTEQHTTTHTKPQTIDNEKGSKHCALFVFVCLWDGMSKHVCRELRQEGRL